MKANRIVTGALFVAVLCVLARQAQTQAPAAASSIDVYFSPRGGCTDAVVAQLQSARESVIVQAYSFTSVPIAKALLVPSYTTVGLCGVRDSFAWMRGARYD